MPTISGIEKKKSSVNTSAQLLIQLNVLAQAIITSISKSDVCIAIHSIDKSKSAGPDGIHCRIIKELVPDFATPLSIIFNASLSDGDIPSDWKVANIRPVFKKGRVDGVSNYRLISLTSIISKIIEKILKIKIVLCGFI